jgi:hypothetical protein
MLWESQLREISARYDSNACLTEGCGHGSALHFDEGFRPCSIGRERCPCVTLRLAGGVRQKPYSAS